MSEGTCRFCKERAWSGLISYGPRHYAHPRCFIEKKGAAAMMDLSHAALQSIPRDVLRDTHAQAEWHEAIAAYHMREAALERRTEENRKILAPLTEEEFNALRRLPLLDLCCWKKKLRDQVEAGTLEEGPLKRAVRTIGLVSIEGLHNNGLWPHEAPEQHGGNAPALSVAGPSGDTP